MFSFRLWNMKRILLKSKEDINIVREWKNHRIRAIKQEGQMKLVIHHHRNKDAFWTYTTYQLTETGEMVKIRDGKYPATFVR